MRNPHGWESLMFFQSFTNKVNVFNVSEFNITYIIFGLAVVLLLIIVTVALAFKIKEFIEKLKYTNIEIRRSSDSERKYWIVRRRKLWLSLFGKLK